MKRGMAMIFLKLYFSMTFVLKRRIRELKGIKREVGYMLSFFWSVIRYSSY